MMKYKENRRLNNIKTLNNFSAKGSITVEAAFVMPIVILTIFALMYLAFYLHDICRIQGAVDLTLHKAGLTVKHEADITTGEVSYEDINDRGVFYLLLGSTDEEEEQIRRFMEQELSEGLFLVKVKRINIEADKYKIKVSVSTDTTVTLPGISYLFDSFPDKIITEEYKVHNPTETLRRTEVVLDTGSSIKGVDELKEKIDKILGSK